MPTILRDKKAVLFRLKEPGKITTVIPTAKLVTHKNETLVAVPHRPDEVRVLRNLGYENIPDPMKFQYDFPGQASPFEAQVESSSFLTMHNRCFCLNSMGLGKTITALWAYDYMRSVKQSKRVLVVCPLSTMEHTWADEIFRHFPDLEATVLYGTKAKRLKLLEKEADIYIINIDGLATIRDALGKRPDIDLIIVDEIAMYRNGTTTRWKVLNTVCNKQTSRRVWGLTGMPTPNAPTDAWAQCRVLLPDHPDIPPYYNKARDRLMVQKSLYKWEPRLDALNIIHGWMQPSIRYSIDDCLDLPEQVFISRDALMSKEQQNAYKTMLNSLQADYLGGKILAVNEGVKASKLIQIACGVAYGVEGTEVILPTENRVEVLREIIEGSEGKVIVFIPLTAVLERVAEEIGREWPTAVVHGATPKAARDSIFRDFQKNAEPHVLIANPGTMSHGLTLTKATTIVWYAPVHSGDTYEQANARIRRPGQTKTTVIAHIAASDIERRIYERLKKKQKMQGLLLDMMKEQEPD